jgi:chemotaxis signal transduction protein
MNTSIATVNHSDSQDLNSSLENRFILTQSAKFTLAIPAAWVNEILRVERSRILHLPFYRELVLGITHHAGSVLPLISTALLLNQQHTNLKDVSTVIGLGAKAAELNGMGLVVDRVLQSAAQSELPADAVILDVQMFKPDLWQPLN